MSPEYPNPCCRCGYCCLIETCPSGQVRYGVGKKEPCPGLSFSEAGIAVCLIALTDPVIIGVGAGCCIKARCVKGKDVLDFASLPPAMKQSIAANTREGNSMMAIEVNNETKEIIEVPVDIRLPKWLWLVLTARARALHGGDVDACVRQLLQVGIESQIHIAGMAMSGGLLCPIMRK
jgi:hypothetical protein